MARRFHQTVSTWTIARLVSYYRGCLPKHRKLNSIHNARMLDTMLDV